MSESYTTEELKKIQSLELEALHTIITVCEKCNIEYFLVGGSVLGAIRHDGFIPWDDDIDVGMTRDNYRRFLKEAPQLLPEKYYLQTPYNGDKNPYFYSKLRINGTKFVEYCNRQINMHHGVFVDIFPFDEVPDEEQLNKEQFEKVQKLIRLFSFRQVPDISEKPITIPDKLKSIFRRSIHFASIVIPYDYLAQKLEKEITKYNGTEQKALACLNFPKRKVNYILKTDLYPLTSHNFDGVSANVPYNYDAYLRTQYNNYMELPPKEQRFGHKPYYVELDMKS